MLPTPTVRLGPGMVTGVIVIAHPPVGASASAPAARMARLRSIWLIGFICPPLSRIRDGPCAASSCPRRNKIYPIVGSGDSLGAAPVAACRIGRGATLAIPHLGETPGLARLAGEVADPLEDRGRAQVSQQRRPASRGAVAALQARLFLFHQLQDPPVLVGVQPVTVTGGAVVQLQVVEPVLEHPQRPPALGAGARGGRRAEHQRALLVVAQVEGLVFEPAELGLAQPHAAARGAVVRIDAVARRAYQLSAAIGALHRAILPK